MTSPASELTVSSIPRLRKQNQERAFIAASRRKDRGLDARLGSANRASMLHRERTGKSLRISKDIVEKEAMYEEVDEWYREKRIRVLQVQSMRIEEQLNQQLLAALTVRASHRGSTSSSSSSAATTASPTSPASSASSVPPQPLACHYQPQQVASRTPQAPMDAMHKESLDIPSLPPSALDKMQTTELNRFTEPSYVMSPRYDSIASLQNKQDEWYSPQASSYAQQCHWLQQWAGFQPEQQQQQAHFTQDYFSQMPMRFATHQSQDRPAPSQEFSSHNLPTNSFLTVTPALATAKQQQQQQQQQQQIFYRQASPSTPSKSPKPTGLKPVGLPKNGRGEPG